MNGRCGARLDELELIRKVKEANIRILLLECAELILERLESMRFGSTLRSSLICSGLWGSIRASWTSDGTGEMCSEGGGMEGSLSLACKGREERRDGHFETQTNDGG